MHSGKKGYHMASASNILLSMRQLIKLYDLSLDEIRKKYKLNHIEVTIISFLHNNPGKDTAGDIASLRMLPKGNVSQGVESLIQKSFLARIQDTSDRRKIHLSLKDEALPIVMEIEQSKIRFKELLFDGFTQEEMDQFGNLSTRMVQNISNIIERK